MLRDDPQCGYFIQMGEPRGRAEDPAAKTIAQTLEGLVEQYPSSKSAGQIRSALLKHYAALERAKKQ
jgi:hypothetical protein